MNGFGGMDWDDLMGMGFRNAIPEPVNPMAAQLISMLRMVGQDNATGLASIMGSLVNVMSDMGYGVNIAVSPDGDSLGLMIVQVDPDKANETFSPDHPGVDAAFVSHFGPGSADSVMDLVRKARGA